jgi:hypothetical protein
MRTEPSSQEFWSANYRGHSIATFNHGRGWLVYVDHVLQHNKLFTSAEAAAAWLRRQVDVSEPRRAG